MSLADRYEKVRQHCLQYGNRHPDSDEVCHQALERAPGLHGITIELAMLCDDQALALARHDDADDTPVYLSPRARAELQQRRVNALYRQMTDDLAAIRRQVQGGVTSVMLGDERPAAQSASEAEKELRDELAMSAPVTLSEIPDTRNWKQIGVSSAVCERVPLEERMAELARRRYAYADAMLAARGGS